MNIPKFWSKGTEEGVDKNGGPAWISRWRSSDVSLDDARANALTAAKKVLQAMINGTLPEQYWYARGPIREEVTERFDDERDELIAAITRNRYGALVLNSSRVMFVDWDAPLSRIPRIRGLVSLIKRLLGRNPPSAKSLHEERTRERFVRFRDEHPDWSLRLYRTAGGLRGLVTHAIFDPTDAATIAALETLGSDPLYIRLCQSQGSFRARLTPKPWRCGAGRSTFAWPREGPAIAQFRTWLAMYESRQHDVATCFFLEVIGPATVHPEVAPIVELHDTLTRANERLPLA